MNTFTVSELARLCGATLEGDGSRRVVGLAALAEAGPDEVSFLGNPRYAAELERTAAGAVLVSREIEVPRSDLSLLRCENPSRAFTTVIEAFRPQQAQPEPGVHASAEVHPSAELAADVSVGPKAVVGAGAVLGPRAVIHPSAVVGPGARIGAGTVLYPCAVVYAGVSIGERCVIHAGAVLGSDGFGFEPTAEAWEKIPQCGTVVVEDDVEIGANTTIDRGRFGATRIGRGAKIDNLVHLAHNVVVGPAALLIAQVGVAGSARIGKRAILAGQVGVVGHVEIGDGARLSAMSGVSKDLPGGADYFGVPARPQAEGLRIVTLQGRLPKIVERLRQLEKKVRELEGGA